MVGRHAVAKNSQGPRAADFANRTRAQTEVGKKRRLLDVGALLGPFVNVAGTGGNFIPARILSGEIAIEFLKHVGTQRRLNQLGNFIEAGPEVFEVNVFAVVSFANRFAR